MEANNEKPVIFISYKTIDLPLAWELKQQIEKVFDAIAFVAQFNLQPSDEWLHEILENLNKAKAIVVLTTPAVEQSRWVGFELGFVWKKIMEKNVKVYSLYIPEARILEILAPYQGKSLGKAEEIQAFFEHLALVLNQGDVSKVDCETIIRLANESYEQHSINQTSASDFNPDTIKRLLNKRFDSYARRIFYRFDEFAKPFNPSRPLANIFDENRGKGTFNEKYILYDDWDNRLDLPSNTSKIFLELVLKENYPKIEIIEKDELGIKLKWELFG